MIQTTKKSRRIFPRIKTRELIGNTLAAVVSLVCEGGWTWVAGVSKGLQGSPSQQENT
jgi:hypothetical protein